MIGRHAALLLACWVSAGCCDCLPNATPPADRKNITIDGQTMPLGIWVLEWASAKMNAEIFKIVAEEALGYNTVDLGHSATVESGLWGVAGCAGGGTGSTPAANCSLDAEEGAAVVSTSHLNFETWDYYLFSTLAKLQADYKARTPVRIGTVGYSGFEGNYFPSTVFSKAYNQEGVPLNFYLNYNASWYEPSRFFDSVHAVNATLRSVTTVGWEPCRDYAPMNDPDQMRDYVSFFGDSAGAQATDGQLYGRCLHDVWWVSPACRHNLTLCVPYLTTSGWGIAGIMHKATAFNMPIAMASIKDFDEWVAVVQATKVMTYWWIPDPSFIDMDMYSCVFPPYDADEHGSGKYTTEFAAVKLEKWAHPELGEAAPVVYATATNMQISMREMQAMLLSQHKDGLTDYDVACTWLRSSSYLDWIPSETDCFVGQGLVGGACAWCPQGTKSEVHSTVAGSRQCTLCPTGKYQNQLGQVNCIPCETGSFAPANGTTACTLCSAGRYANATEQTACETCGRANEMTMQRMVVKGSLRWEYLQGSKSASDCVCDRGFRSFEANVSAEAEYSGCRPCGVGMECRGSDDVVIGEGFYSWYDFSIYKCYGDAPACKGGRAGETCQPGRIGLLCARCPSGTHETETGGCKACEGSNILPFVVTCLGGGLAMIGLYVGISRENIATRSKAMCTIMFLFGLVMLSIQQMGVYGTMAVSWDEPVKTVLSVTQLLNFDVEVLNLACVVGQPSPFISYLNKVLVIIVLLSGMCMIHLVALAIYFPIKQEIHTLVAVLGTILVGFLTAMVNIAIIPFECVEHPNGRATVRRYPTVICGGGEVHGGHGDEYWAMVAVGASSIAAVLVFVACCVFVVQQFPRAMLNGNVIYLHKYNFLFVRFRPDSYWYSLFFILRSLFIAMAPMLPGLFYQILVVIGIQVVALPVIARFSPWRTQAVNLIDCILVMCMIMFNAFAGFFIEEVDTRLVSAFAFAFLATVFAVLLAGIAQAVYTHWSYYGKKPFKYFLSHHKGGAGAFARLLKMQLLEAGAGKGRLQVFLDCDNLTNLEMLFDFVGSQSENVVVLMSKELLLRPWCVGELVTAMLRGVPMRPVRFPDFTELTDGFIDKYDSHVDVNCLVPCGIGLDMIRDMLLHIRRMPHLSLPSRVNAAVIRGLAKSIETGVGDSTVAAHYPSDPPQCRKVVLIVDHTNWESASTALVLGKCMRRDMICANFSAEAMPNVLGQEEELPATAEVGIFVLSNGAFMEPPYIKLMLAAEERKLTFLPVIWEDGFRFPSKAMLSEIASVAPVVFAPHGITADPERIAATVACIFKEIAVVFSPHHSNESILMVQAKDVVGRLKSGHLQPLDAKDVETTGENRAQGGGAWTDEAESNGIGGKITASL